MSLKRVAKRPSSSLLATSTRSERFPVAATLSAAAVNRRTLIGYVKLPNYQNYWVEAGYEEEMQAIRKAIAAGEEDKIPSLMSDHWLSDVTLYGSAAEVRDGIEAWRAAGVTTPIVVPSSTKGGQMVALQELIELYR